MQRVRDPSPEGSTDRTACRTLREGRAARPTADVGKDCGLTRIGSQALARRSHGVRVVTPSSAPPLSRDELERSHRSLVRIALDLHDGPLQDLGAIGFGLKRLAIGLDELPVDTSRAAHDVAEIQRQLASLEAALRALAERSDTGFENATLIDLIDSEVARFRRRSQATIEIDIVGDVEPETASQRIALNRVLRESLTNVARHAGATDVRIGVVESKNVVYLQIVDNGVGFDPTLQLRGSDGRAHLGLEGMRRRLELLDGTLTVETRPGGPTSITAAVKRWRPSELAS